MNDALVLLKEIHKEIKAERPKSNKLIGNAAYRNGFEDGYKLITKRMKAFIEATSLNPEISTGTNTSVESPKG